MTRTLRNRLSFAVGVLALTVPADLIIARALTYPTMHDRAEHWVGSLSTEEKSDYLRNKSIPGVYYKLLKQSLTPDEAARVFVDKIAAFRRATPNLSRDQESYLQATVAFMQMGKAFGVGIDRTGVEALIKDGKRLFPKREDQSALFVLTPSPSSTKASEPGLNRTVAWLLRSLPSGTLFADTDEVWCECSQTDDWCGSGKHCCDGQSCSPSVYNPGPCGFMLLGGCWQPGCGTLLYYQCTGMCVNNIMN